MKRHPHILYRQITGGSVKNPKGQWVKGTPTWERVCECREEPAAGTKVAGVDQTIYPISSTIYMKPSESRFKEGETVEVRNEDGTVRLTGTVKNFDPGQINFRLWV